jgi:peptide/nickel transport system permease protein
MGGIWVYKYIFRRLLFFIPMLFIITVLIFTFARLAPGDAFSGEPNPEVTFEDLERKRELYGLKDPPHIQYLSWLKNVSQGEFGVSMRFEKPVADLINERIGNTLLLAAVSLAITLIISIPIGIYSARYPYTPFDYTATTFGFLGVATPSFYLGLVLIYVFSIKLGWLPSQGTVSSTNLVGLELWIDKLKHVLMPAVALGTGGTATYMRYMRSEMMEVMNRDYIRTARSKGVPESSILFKHTLRNALIPVITLLGFEFGALLSGAIITEGIFSWPGMGSLLLNAISNRDYPIIMAVNLILAVSILFGNLLADIFYAIVDPRIRYD